MTGQEGRKATYLDGQPTAASVGGLVCLVCREESGDGLGPSGLGCSDQRAMDCGAQYPPGTPTFCFSRDSHLSSGAHVVEKLCVSDYALQVSQIEECQPPAFLKAWIIMNQEHSSTSILFTSRCPRAQGDPMRYTGGVRGGSGEGGL